MILSYSNVILKECLLPQPGKLRRAYFAEKPWDVVDCPAWTFSLKWSLPIICASYQFDLWEGFKRNNDKSSKKPTYCILFKLLLALEWLLWGHTLPHPYNAIDIDKIRFGILPLLRPLWKFFKNLTRFWKVHKSFVLPPSILNVCKYNRGHVRYVQLSKCPCWYV